MTRPSNARGTGGRQVVKQITPVPIPIAHPNCLIRDLQPLPDRYMPPLWARDIVEEWKKREALQAVGAYPTQSALVSGPSGVGKTTASRWIAAQLNLPLFSLSLASTIESYMGATGSNLDLAVRYGTEINAVLVFDELDCVAGGRATKNNDVGEIWRITNTLIQSLDAWHAQERSSFLLATTNMPESIDVAIRRRFETEVSVEFPSVQDLSEIAGVALPANARMSHAKLRRMVLQAKRTSVLSGSNYELTLLSMIGGEQTA